MRDLSRSKTLRSIAVLISTFTLSLGSLVPVTVHAAGIEISPRADVRLGSGKPVNDVLGYAVVLRYGLNQPGWYVGAAIDSSPEFDVEYPLTFLGLVGPDDDSVGSSSMVMAFVERRYGVNTRQFQPFWSLGAGINSIDIDPLTGVLNNGTEFDLRIDAGTETVIEGTIGVRYQFNPRWSLMSSLLLQHRFADWTVVEQVSGVSTAVEDYTVSGAYVALAYRF